MGKLCMELVTLGALVDRGSEPEKQALGELADGFGATPTCTPDTEKDVNSERKTLGDTSITPGGVVQTRPLGNRR